MVVVAAQLQTQGIVVFPYIDYWLIVVESREVLLEQVHSTLSLLHLLELQVNLTKLTLSPSQRISVFVL